MNGLLSPTFDKHRRWIEDLITTPEHEGGPSETCLLTGDGSPTEHVLRGSKSWAARSYRSRTSGLSLRVPSNKENRSTNDAANSRESSSSLHAPLTTSTLPVLGEIVPNSQILRPTGGLKFRPSPTPSLKKKKAEAIVKAHGSPQHIRVTAGGRIVPSEQSPLCHPRYGYSAIKTNGGLIKFAPNHPMGKAQWTQATQNGFVAQDVNGRLCQIVNGTILPLNEVDGALRLYVPAPNLNVSTRGSSFGPSVQDHRTASGLQRSISQSKPATPDDPPLPAQTNALELEYSKLELELKELDKTEALHGRTMAKTAKDALIGKRRELVVTLDNIRKAIKSIKSAPRLEVPHSPPQMPEDHQALSPPRNRLPAFLQQRGNASNDLKMAPFPPAFNNFFGMGQPQSINGHYGTQTTPSPDGIFNPAAYGMPPLFVAPPPFDGSMATPYGGYGDPLVNGQEFPGRSDLHTSAMLDVNDHLPQTDGANSIRQIQKVSPPRQSRAVDIKAPEPKNANGLKSILNPMSPAYKPGAGLLKASGNTDRPAPKSVKDRAPTPLSPLHQLRPAIAAKSAGRSSDGTISPSKRSPHLHSSSVSSFETADFFPRNTREYSSRRYVYPDDSEDKENTAPLRSVEGAASSPITPPDDAGVYSLKRAPPPPAGTPASSTVTSNKNHRSDQHTSETQHSDRPNKDSLPDRQTHNLSPKSKRQDFLFIEEHPSQYTDEGSSSPQKSHEYREELCATNSSNDQIDFSEASRDWIEGYRAGLSRKAVGSDRHGDFLDGYCAGLLKSKSVRHGPSNGSPTKSTARRPSPSMPSSNSSTRAKLDERAHVAPRPPLETSMHSMDTMKEAVLAPQNEDAILTPSAEGPHADDAHYDLGAWARAHGQMASTEEWDTGRGEGLAGFPFPHRTSSMMERQGFTVNRGHNGNQHSHPPAPGVATKTAIRTTSTTSNVRSSGIQSTTSSMNAAHSSGPASSYPPSNRVSSMTSIDSNMYRQWPGYRVFSPHLEWKSASSVAQVTGMAAGSFTNRESEGAQSRLSKHVTELADTPDTDTFHTAQQQRVVSVTSNPGEEYRGRFKEGSLDGITNPPNSPHPASPPMSPSISPRHSPGKDSRKRDGQSKSSSPAKAKFEHIAEKVGIKVSVGKREEGTPPNTPPGKRNWRNVWRGGARRDDSKDDSMMPLLK